MFEPGSFWIHIAYKDMYMEILSKIEYNKFNVQYLNLGFENSYPLYKDVLVIKNREDWIEVTEHNIQQFRNAR